jgi:hypothetical protein
MKARTLLLALSVLVGQTASVTSGADGAMIGCPAGQVVQGINTETGQPVCVAAGGTVAQLVDRDDVVIGQYMGNGVISRELMGYRVDICCMATATGDPEPLIGPSPLYASADCQGTAYFFADPRIESPLFRIGSLLESGDIVFGGDPATRITPLSYFDELDGCLPMPEPGLGPVPVHPVVSVPLSTLGAPPFKVK